MYDTPDELLREILAGEDSYIKFKQISFCSRHHLCGSSTRIAQKRGVSILERRSRVT